MATDWVIIHDGTKGDMAYALECKRCGMVQKVAVPIIADCYLAMAKVFLKSHRRCRQQEAAEKGGG